MVYSTDKITMSGLFSNIPGAKERAGQDKKQKSTEKLQQVRIWLDRKNRKGKAVTLIKGLGETENQLKGLAKFLKEKCGVGGAVKNGEIILQGNDRDKVLRLLVDKGYINAKKAGG